MTNGNAAAYLATGRYQLKEVDSEFYDRADAHISLSNEQLSEQVSPGEVSASFMYTAARFNAWLSACGFASGEEMAAAREETIDYFVSEYRKMLEEHLDEYITDFDKLMGK